MSNLKIASWNVNSVRARIGIVERLLREEAPDILCLQETKAEDKSFPSDHFRQMGYVHQKLTGQRMASPSTRASSTASALQRQWLP